MKSVALFGGSFDPPHKGHIAVVEAALKRLDIDKLVIVPTYLNPFKSRSFASPHQRLEWLETIFGNDPRLEISDFEIRQNRSVPSIKTVREFEKRYEKIYFIIGADNLASLEKWFAYDELNAKVEWVVAKRGDIHVPDNFICLDIDVPVSSTELRKGQSHHYISEALRKEIATFYKETNATEN